MTAGGWQTGSQPSQAASRSAGIFVRTFTWLTAVAAVPAAIWLILLLAVSTDGDLDLGTGLQLLVPMAAGFVLVAVAHRVQETRPRSARAYSLIGFLLQLPGAVITVLLAGFILVMGLAAG